MAKLNSKQWIKRYIGNELTNSYCLPYCLLAFLPFSLNNSVQKPVGRASKVSLHTGRGWGTAGKLEQGIGTNEK